MPTEQPTDNEKRARIEGVILRMRRGETVGQIRQWLKGEFGVTTRTCDRYLSRARKEISESVGRTEGDLRTEAMAFYEGVRADPTATVWQKLKAQEQLDSLMGLAKPRKVAMTDASGNGPATIRIEARALQQAPPEELAKIAAAFDSLQNLAQQPGGG
jgi:hypothetical protein